MADQKINALPVKTAPTTGDKMLMIGAAEEYQIDYDQLATAILNKLTSKTYALDQGTKTLIAALNELNSNIDSAAYERGTRIPRDSNLNNYTDPGVYYVENNSDASTIQNYPPGVSVGCRIEVRAGGAGWIRQRLYPNNNSDVYDRFTDADYAFNTSWYRIQSTSVN